MKKLLEYLSQKKVIVKIDKCTKNSMKPMFEKMIMQTEPEDEFSREEVEIEHVWGKNRKNIEFENDGSFITKSNSTFVSYYTKVKNDFLNEISHNTCDDDLCNCYFNYVQLYEKTSNKYVGIKRISEFRMLIVFYVGIFFGILVGVCCYYVGSIVHRRCWLACKKQHERQKLRDRITRETNSSVLASNSHQTERNELITRNVSSSPQTSPLPSSPSPIRLTSQRACVQINHAMPARSNTRNYEISQTAQLIHRLFRNRETLPPEIVPVRANNLTTQINSINDQQMTPEVEPFIENDIQCSVESILNMSRSSTPPPAYCSVINENI
jgi:hypothetical protein